MQWLKRIFRRADYEGAKLAIENAIRDNAPPDIAEIRERHRVSEKRAREFFKSSLAALVQQRVADGISAGLVPSQQIYDEVISLGFPPDGAKGLLEDAVSHHFTDLVLSILEDGQVDPTEEKATDRIHGDDRPVGALA